MKNNGSALIEAVFVLNVLIPTLLASLFLGYLGFARLWISFVLHESMICAAEGEFIPVCREEALQKIEYAPWVKTKNFTLMKVSHLCEVSVEYSVADRVNFQSNQVLDLKDLNRVSL